MKRLRKNKRKVLSAKELAEYNKNKLRPSKNIIMGKIRLQSLLEQGLFLEELAQKFDTSQKQILFFLKKFNLINLYHNRKNISK